MKIKIPELLAPAGSMDSLHAALNAGADSVYLAGKRFGARHYASNFNDAEIKEAIDLAHLRGVKVYVTVNTLIKQKELEDVATYLIFLYEIGVDAILVQDPGVAFISQKIVPGLKLHASTQMTIHNEEGVRWAAEMGFKRVVLAREMELSEIKRMDVSKEIEVEIFAHGALCYSYSGQCLMSSFIGGRSGNRGMCAQPCRKTYSLVWGKKNKYGKPAHLRSMPLEDKYLLSTRDLSLYNHLDMITSLNIDSLKIEGRMRSPQYVATVVDIYRRALDAIHRGKWKPSKEDIINLKLAFNRDFTDGYMFEDDHGGVMGRNRPGNRGLYIGPVIKYHEKEVYLKYRDVVPEKGDGIVFISPHKPDYGMRLHHISKISGKLIKFKVPRIIKPGTEVYLTRRQSLLSNAQQIMSKKYEIPFDLDVHIQKNGTFTAAALFNVGERSSKVYISADFKMEKAIAKPMDKEAIIKQFIKTGGTPFKFRKININYPGGLFAPISELNRFRRDLLEKMKLNLLDSYRPSENEIFKANDMMKTLKTEFSKVNLQEMDENPHINAYVDDLNVLKRAAGAGCKRIYFNPFNLYRPPECNSNNNLKNVLKEIMEASSLCRENEVEFILKLPQITSNLFLHELKPILIAAFKAGIDGIMVGGMGAAKFISDLNPDMDLLASASLNIWNAEAVKALEAYFKCFTISPELSRKEIQDMVSSLPYFEVELLVQGNLESLISKDCLPCLLDDEIFGDSMFLGIEDAKKHVFPLRLDTQCRTYILNSVELTLIDYIPHITKMGIDYVALDLEGRSEKYAHKICSYYQNMLQNHTLKDLKKIKKEIKIMSWGGITTGNFLKGTEDG